tara:strand:- start:365 stop:964 length:600 start_codon:yes stop_codon:yes gene_type:complete
MLQLSISIAIMKFDQERQLLSDYNPFAVLILSVIVLLIITYKLTDPRIPFIAKQVLFLVVSVFFGLLLSKLTHFVDQQVVEAATVSTLANFFLFLVIGLIIVYFKYDLGWMGIFLIIAIVGVIITRIFLLFTDEEQQEKSNYYLSRFVVLLFSLFILYDTNNILLKYKNKDKTDCIMGALNYYLDIINLFTEYLQISNE